MANTARGGNPTLRVEALQTNQPSSRLPASLPIQHRNLTSFCKYSAVLQLTLCSGGIWSTEFFNHVAIPFFKVALGLDSFTSSRWNERSLHLYAAKKFDGAGSTERMEQYEVLSVVQDAHFLKILSANHRTLRIFAVPAATGLKISN